jgi:hypothetical protein
VAGEWVGAHHCPIDVVGDMLEEGVSIAALQASEDRPDHLLIDFHIMAPGCE